MSRTHKNFIADLTLNGAMDAVTDPITFSVNESVADWESGMTFVIDEEIFVVTGTGANQLTADRQQEGTSMVTHPDESVVTHKGTALDLARASQAEAEAGTDEDKVMTPLRTAEAFAALFGGALIGLEVFTVSDTYSKNPDATSVLAIVSGGGAAGGGATSVDRLGEGGSAGGTAIKRILNSALGSSETVTVGSGASGDSGAGGDGGTSSFGTHCTGNGGIGGAGNVQDGIGTAGGTASGGDINISGGRGGCGADTGIGSISGMGGASFWGGGGGQVGSIGAGLQHGQDGEAYGSGGSGAAMGSDGPNNGGSGKDGIVVILEFA